MLTIEGTLSEAVGRNPVDIVPSWGTEQVTKARVSFEGKMADIQHNSQMALMSLAWFAKTLCHS
jgi:hypothetical protein